MAAAPDWRDRLKLTPLVASSTCPHLDSRMEHEADLSTEPAGARAPSWLPRPDGDAGRPQGVGEPPRQGSRQAERLDRIGTIAARRDFLAANSAKRAATPAFVLLVRQRGDPSPAMRAGFTVTKKIGNAVVRNRIKRRLRALVRQVLPVAGSPGADHILIGRTDALVRDFAVLALDLEGALNRCGVTR